MDYDNSNSGVLFQNREHAKNPKAPKLRGTGRVTIDGQQYELELAAWTKQSERAGKFLSLSIKLKGDHSAASRNAPAQQQDKEPDVAW
ncbi:MAG TPA: hypothetical protein VKB84_23315 [Candidatus Binataceae bacterium]|nr:hypothetical protein [Candidatus Binataceae bacterium]